jgi:hypothetical protein
LSWCSRTETDDDGGERERVLKGLRVRDASLNASITGFAAVTLYAGACGTLGPLLLSIALVTHLIAAQVKYRVMQLYCHPDYSLYFKAFFSYR